MTEKQQLDAALVLMGEALAHLRTSITQSLPSDDQIIMGHVRDASELLSSSIEALERLKAVSVSDFF